MNTPDPIKVLVIEDDEETRANLRDILELDAHAVVMADSARAALAREDWKSIAAIILDRRLPDATADQLLPKLKALAPDAAIIVVTGYADLQGAIVALRHGATDYILKPIEPDGLRARVRRVAEFRAAQERARLAERRFRLMVQNSSDIITAFDADGTIIYQNPAVEHVLGYRPEDREGKSAFRDAIADPEDFEVLRELLMEACRQGKPVTRELRLRHADGTYRHIEAVAQDLFADPSVRAIVANYRDITERKRAEERALQSERLAAIGQMVTGLAHESRNALQRGQACLEMLALEVADRPRAKDLLCRLQRAQDDLARVYDEVRDYAAPIRLDRHPCDLADVWRTAWSDLQPMRDGRTTAIDEKIEVADTRCSADEFRLVRMFRNLFENALAACADPVEITIRCTTHELDGRSAFRVSLRDNGPGLSTEAARQAFDAFYTTKIRGTGLGLAICRRIVEAHGGSIALGGSQICGAEFLIALPRGET